MLRGNDQYSEYALTLYSVGYDPDQLGSDGLSILEAACHSLLTLRNNETEPTCRYTLSLYRTWVGEKRRCLETFQVTTGNVLSRGVSCRLMICVGEGRNTCRAGLPCCAVKAVWHSCLNMLYADFQHTFVQHGTNAPTPKDKNRLQNMQATQSQGT